MEILRSYIGRSFRRSEQDPLTFGDNFRDGFGAQVRVSVAHNGLHKLLFVNRCTRSDAAKQFPISCTKKHKRTIASVISAKYLPPIIFLMVLFQVDSKRRRIGMSHI